VESVAARLPARGRSARASAALLTRNDLAPEYGRSGSWGPDEARKQTT
jgi:hypothetical protein